MEILSFSYSFVYFYFFGFYENLKSKNTRDHSEHVLHHSIASDYYISIILHHTVASARHQYSVASDYCISIILHQAYCISPMYHQPSHHLIFIVKSMVEVLDFLLIKVTVLICTYENSVIQTNYLYWVLIINGVPHHLTCLR